MKAIKLSIASTALLLLASVTFSSFTDRKGGEGFEIYLNNKLVVQQFGNQ